MDTLFAAALRRLPRDLSTALEQAGLDDACTLANCPRASLVDLQLRGFCVDLVGGTGSIGGMAASDIDVATGGTAGKTTFPSGFFPFRSSTVGQSGLSASLCEDNS